MVDIRQSPHWAQFMQNLGWEVEELKQGTNQQFLYLKKLPLIGYLAKGPRLQKPVSWEKFDQLAKDKRISLLKIEPYHRSSDKVLLDQLKENSFQFDRWALHPTKSILIDLRSSEEEILSQLEKDTRYGVKAAQRRGVRVVKSNDLERFLRIYHSTAKRQGFSIGENELRALWDVFFNEGKGFILIAQWNKADIAGCIVLFHDKTAYYYHAASLRNLRELYAPYLVVWEALCEAKRLNNRDFDLEGIYDPRIPSTKKWRGFTHFKRGFRGEEIELLGSFVKTYNPFLSTLYKLSNFSY